MAKATPQQWIGYLTNARQKGVKPEELEDAGLLIDGYIFSYNKR